MMNPVPESKVVGAQTEAKRQIAALNGAYGVGMFVVLLGLPILNLIIGFFVLVSIAAPVFTRSNRIGVDLGWLLLGTVLCLVGMMTYPVLPMINYMNPWPSVLLGAVIRGIVFWWIVQGRLGHLFIDKEALAKL